MNTFDQWDTRARLFIPGGTSTIAKSTSRIVGTGQPLYITAGNGPYCYDVKGRRWIDFEMAMGTLLFGHSHPKIVSTICKAAQKGTSFSFPNVDEVLYAEVLLSRFSSFDSVRFLKSGNDAVQAACRISRYWTQKSKILYSSYHGWSDGSTFALYGNGDAIKLGLPASVGDDVLRCESKNIDELLTIISVQSEVLAAVVLCPNMWSKIDLQKVAEACKKHLIFLIFDEVTSGMRVGKTAVCGRMGVKPDILCLSKGMASGLPLSCILGSTDILGKCEDLKITNAHATDNIAFNVALAVESMIAEYEKWTPWEALVESLVTQLQRVIDSHTTNLEIIGDTASFCVRDKRSANFWQDPFRFHFLKLSAQNNLMTKGYIVPSAAHTESHFEIVLKCLSEAIESYEEN